MCAKTREKGEIWAKDGSLSGTLNGLLDFPWTGSVPEPGAGRRYLSSKQRSEPPKRRGEGRRQDAAAETQRSKAGGCSGTLGSEGHGTKRPGGEAGPVAVTARAAIAPP